MLAKKAWNWITNSQSLVAQVLKAKYFPNNDLLSAKIGSNPSFTLQSICTPRALWKENLQWNIGKGENIFVWSENWINRSNGNKLKALTYPINVNLKVAELLRADSKMWDADLIQSLSMLKSTGIFTVKTTYYKLAINNLVDYIIWWLNGNWPLVWKLRDCLPARLKLVTKKLPVLKTVFIYCDIVH